MNFLFIRCSGILYKKGVPIKQSLLTLQSSRFVFDVFFSANSNITGLRRKRACPLIEQTKILASVLIILLSIDECNWKVFLQNLNTGSVERGAPERSLRPVPCPRRRQRPRARSERALREAARHPPPRHARLRPRTPCSPP